MIDLSNLDPDIAFIIFYLFGLAFVGSIVLSAVVIGYLIKRIKEIL
jgi:hypothetical protein